jgi:hypothetical protein
MLVVSFLDFKIMTGNNQMISLLRDLTGIFTEQSADGFDLF